MSRFSPAGLPGLTGRTAVVTGANSGIGLAAARVLAERGARVVLAVRPAGRAARARDRSAARRLWEVSEQLTGTRFPLDAPAPPAS